MKGLQEETDTGTVFLVVKNHSICEESKTERPGFNPIEVKNPKTGETFNKYHKRYKSVEALFCKIEWRDTQDKYETRFLSWRLHLNAAGTPCILEIPFDGRVSTRFMKLAENIDFTQPAEISAWYDAKNEATAFNIRQDGASVPQKYTREDPGDCPEPVKNFQGKLNFDAQKEFLHDRMMNVVIPAVEAAGNEMPHAEKAMSATAGGLPENDDDIADEDLPF